MRAMHLYVAYDKKAEMLFGQIMRFSNDAAAIRIFTEALADKGLLVGQHPEDFELLCLAIIDEDTGIIDPLDKPHRVISGQDWIEANKDRDIPRDPERHPAFGAPASS